MAVTRTFSIIKPDATRRNITGAVTKMLEDAGLRVVASKRIHMTKEQAEGFYAVHKERPFFGELVEFMTSGPVVVQVLEGENAMQRNRDVMGATKIHEPFDLPDQGVKVCFVDTPGAGGALDGTQIELIEPLPGNTSIAGFLEKNPAGGQHHMCYEVPDIHAAKAEFEAMGKRVLGEPRIGAHGTLIFFLHPKDMGGVLTEIMETPKGGH